MKMFRYKVIIGVMAILLTTVLITGCGSRKSEQSRVQGDTSYRLGQYDEAKNYYLQAESINPSNVMAKIGLALTLKAMDDPEGALEKLDEAIALEPESARAYVEKTQMLLDLNRNDEALELARGFREINTEAGGLLEAKVLEANGQISEALVVMRELKSKHPESPQISIALADVYLALDQPEDAEIELKMMLDQIDPGYIRARMRLVEALRRQGKVDEIVNELTALVEENPDDNDLKLALSRARLFSNDVAGAEAMARDVLQIIPESGWANFVVGAVLVEQNNFADAIPHLQVASRALPQESLISEELNRAIQMQRGGRAQQPQVATTTSQTPLASPVVRSEVVDEDWNTMWMRGAMGTLLRNRDAILALGDEELTEKLVYAAMFTNNDALATEIATQHLPEDATTRQFVVVLQSRNIEEILAFFEGWQESETERIVMRENALAMSITRAGGRARAIHILSAAIQEVPEQAVSLFNIIQVFRTARTPEFAASALQRLIAMYPDNVDAHSLLFVTLREVGKRDEARIAAENTYSLYPSMPEAILNLTQAYMDSGDVTMARRILSRGIDSRPDMTELKVAMVGVLVRAGDIEEALTLARSIQDRSFDRQLRGYTIMAHADLEQWDAVINEVASSPSPEMALSTRMVALAAYIKAGRAEEAAAFLIDNNQNQPIGGVLGTVILTALGESVDAAADLSDADRALSDRLAGDREALSDFVLGVAFQFAGLHDRSFETFMDLNTRISGESRIVEGTLNALREAVEVENPAVVARDIAVQNAEMPTAWLGLAQILQKNNDLNAEREALEMAVAVGEDIPEVWYRNAEFYERQDLMAQAIAPYRQLIALVPDDPAANNNLAYCLLMSNENINEAMEYAVKAAEQLPNDPNVLHTLGVAQLRLGNLEESRQNLSMALEIRPSDPTLLLDYGQLLIEQGETQAGKQHIEMAITYAEQLGLSFPRIGEARDNIAGIS